MAYDPTLTAPVAGRITNAALLLVLGILIGLVLAGGKPDPRVGQSVTPATSGIPGEDWHGNVRRSTP